MLAYRKHYSSWGVLEGSSIPYSSLRHAHLTPILLYRSQPSGTTTPTPEAVLMVQEMLTWQYVHLHEVVTCWPIPHPLLQVVSNLEWDSDKTWDSNKTSESIPGY